MRRLFLSALAAGSLATPTAAQTIAITGGTVVTAPGEHVEGGTVLFRNGVIVAAGRNVTVPAGATRVDASGKWVTAGFIHVSANAGLGVRGLNGFGESAQSGDITASFVVRDGIDPDAVDIPVTRAGGVTTGLLRPNGTFLAGQGTLVDFAGDRIEAMEVKSPAAMVINLTAQARSAGGGARAGTLARLRSLFADAQEYARRRADYRRAAIQPLGAPAAELEALLPVLDGREPVVFLANTKYDIQNVLRLAAEFKVKAILGGGTEAWKVAPELAAANIPVWLNPMEDIPSFDGLGARLDNATLLQQAGVAISLAHQDPGGERNLRFGAGNTVRNGLTWDQAFRAVTLGPAEQLGIADRYGSLAPGKVANVVVWSGDPFEFSSVAERVYIRGQETTLRTRETELLERYRTLPPKY